MTDISVFSTLAEPFFFTVDSTPASAYELAWRLADANVVSRFLRGHKMRTLQSLFDEFGAAMQFPDYFGENWDALDECLADLSWMPGTAYALVITNALMVLDEEGPDQLRTLVRVLEKVAREWATPVDSEQPWDRPGVPFHVVFQVSGTGAARLSPDALGIEVATLGP